MESQTDKARHSVLGINKSTTARKVVRLLLADSLKQEENWERQLELQEDSNIDDGGILIRCATRPFSGGYERFANKDLGMENLSVRVYNPPGPPYRRSRYLRQYYSKTTLNFSYPLFSPQVPPASTIR